MTQLSDHIHKTADDLAATAEHYAATNKSPQAIIQQVMQMGAKAMLTKNFTLAQGKQLTAMMIAALSLATYEETGQEEKV